MSESDIHADTLPVDEEPEAPVDHAPEADAVEQRQDVVEHESADEPADVPDDVDPADAVEQSRVVDFDEDDYR